MPEMSFPFGPATQAEIYGGGADDLPIDTDEWESRAKAVLEPGPFDYIAGGAGGEWTMRANRDAFGRWRLRPAMLAGNQQRDLYVSVLGTSSPAPFFLAPVGVLSAARPDGDLSVARAAAVAGVPWVVSTAASTPMETIADAMGAAPRWYQLYWVNDREVVTSLVQRAEAAGYTAIVLSLDTLQLGWRVRDLRNRRCSADGQRHPTRRRRHQGARPGRERRPVRPALRVRARRRRTGRRGARPAQSDG